MLIYYKNATNNFALSVFKTFKTAFKYDQIELKIKFLNKTLKLYLESVYAFLFLFSQCCNLEIQNHTKY